MKKPLCDALFLYHATTTEDDLNPGPFYIVNCVFVPILSITAIIFQQRHYSSDQKDAGLVTESTNTAS